MMAPALGTCPDCGCEIQYWHVVCPDCHHFLGFPNYRAAELEREELHKRYLAARDDATFRGVLEPLERLELMAQNSYPVIAMAIEACDDTLRNKKYWNYDERITIGHRDPAKPTEHSDREMVGARLFPMYSQHIHYAVLSTDGYGLTNYGTIALRWNVAAGDLIGRISLLDENSFQFYERHNLGNLGAEIPAGHRATWSERGRLVAAKLAARVSASMCDKRLGSLLLRAGPTRREDDFVEIAIYAERGLTTIPVDMIMLQKAPVSTEQIRRWELVCEMSKRMGIAVAEAD